MGHNAWDRAYTTDHSYQNPNVYEWMLKHTLGKKVNQPPTAKAGADKSITLPTNSVTITGSASDPDGKVSKYQWTKTSGSTATMLNANSSTLKVSGMVEGTYTFRLTVTDNNNATAYDDVKVVVKPKPNIAPKANAGKDLSITGNSVVVQGTASDGDGKIANVYWDKISGGSAKIVSPNSLKTQISNLETGTYTFRLTVTDNDGAKSSDKLNINVSPNISGNGNYVQGIHYDYYELDRKYNHLPVFSSLKPKASGVASTLTLDKRKRDDRFALQFQGYLKVSNSGSHKFKLGSDDGSQLYIDGKLVVNNDGLHPYATKENSLYMKAGYHKILVNYYENYGQQVFKLTWEGASMPATEISPDLLFHDGSNDKNLAAQNVNGLTPGIQYYYYEGLCNKLPDFSTLKPVKMGYTDRIDLNERQRDDMFQMVFNGYIDVPQAGRYKFYLGSDDGSKLYMDGKLLIDNGRLHPYEEDVAVVDMEAGYHAFKLEYFERYVHQSLNLSWEGPGMPKQKIDPQYFFCDPNVQIFSDPSLSFYPNPNNGNHFYVKSDQTLDSNVQLTIVDKNGGTHVVSQQEISRVSDSEIQINLNNSLSSGLYIIQEYFPNSGETTSQTFIVQ